MTCTVCRHPDHIDIDKLLVAGLVPETLSKRFGLSASSIRRHKREHILPEIRKALERKEEKAALKLADRVARLIERTDNIWQAAEEIFAEAKSARARKDALAALKLALEASREMQSRLEFQGRVTGELAQPVAAGAGPVVLMVPVIVTLKEGPHADTADLTSRLSYEDLRTSPSDPSVPALIEAEWEPAPTSGETPQPVQDAEQDAISPAVQPPVETHQ